MPRPTPPIRPTRPGRPPSGRQFNAVANAVAGAYRGTASGTFIDSSGRHDRRETSPVDDVWIDALITGHTAVGGSTPTWQWTYDWEEATQSADGYGNWAALADGRTSGTGDGAPARNEAEDMNPAAGATTGMLGIGTDAADFSASAPTVTLMPIPTGRKVRVRISTADDGTPAYWIDVTNGVHVSCT